MNDRTSGLLLHVTSLPSEEAVGTLGPEAHAFLDLLVDAGQRMWQILPVHPTIVGDSPFQGPSVFAGNPNLVSLRALVETGDLAPAACDAFLQRWRRFCQEHEGRGDGYVEYGFLWAHKVGFDTRLEGWEQTPLRRAYAGFRQHASRERREAFDRFRARNARWLEDYARFMALKEQHGFEVLWCHWPEPARDRHPGFEEALSPETLDFYRYVQFVFDEQMTRLRARAAEKGVALVGDLAIYPAYDSADVWAHRSLFQLDSQGRMTQVAAVPPDYFSATGQLWGNPLYDWDRPESRGPLFDWWLHRLRSELVWFDLIKIDHFRGFASYGRVSADARTAVDARWTPGPGKALFDHLRRHLGHLPVIAEDLGVITDEVKALLWEVGCPGMKVFQFAHWAAVERDHPRLTVDPYLPHAAEIQPRSVFYTGTHDNETLRQRIESMSPEERDGLAAYLALSSEPELPWNALDVISGSPAQRVLFPVQDILYLAGEARMNNPSDDAGWWRWRLTAPQWNALIGVLGEQLRELTRRHGRT